MKKRYSKNPERRARQHRRDVEKAFKGGRANRDWKGSHTEKKTGKTGKGGGCLGVVVLVGGTAAAVVAAWKGIA